jgi:hypothetical protein
MEKTLKLMTIEIDGVCFDLPRDMQIPQKGSTVFIEGKSGVVENIHYHVRRGRVHMVSIFTTID